MDSFQIKAVIDELQQELPGTMVSKWKTLRTNSILMTTRTDIKTHHLLISFDTLFPRIHLTRKKWDLRDKESPFVAILNKYLLNATLRGISLPRGERLCTFHFATTQGIYDRLNLTIQMFGAYSNAILWEERKQFYIDSLKPISDTVDDIDLILKPHVQSKIKENPFDTHAEKFHDLFLMKKEENFADFLKKTFLYFSPQLAEAAKKSFDMRNSAEENPAHIAWEIFQLIISTYIMGKWQPGVVMQKSDDALIIPTRLSVIPFNAENTRLFDSIQEAADFYYYSLLQSFELKRRKKELTLSMVNRLKKIRGTVKKRERELKEASKGEVYKKYGDLILSNIYQMKQGMKNIEVNDYSVDPPILIDIPLDPALQPAANAQRYYKKASKMKKRTLFLDAQLMEDEQEIEELTSEIEKINSITGLDELEEFIRKKSEGQIPGLSLRIEKNKKLHITRMHFYRFLSSDGWFILVGKNSKENDLLTFQEAQPDDFWLHARDFPGSHVLVKNPKRYESMPPETMVESALLAAYYSRAKKEKAVDVQVTKKKFLRKPKGFPPGKVLIEREKNFRVTLEEDRIKQLFEGKNAFLQK